MYFIIDWYENVPGKPLTCIIQVNNEKLKSSDLKLPSYLEFDREITDNDMFFRRTMAEKDYEYKSNSMQQWLINSEDY